MSYSIRFVVFLWVAAVLAGPAPAQNAAKRAPQHRAAAALTNGKTDSQIETAIRARFAQSKIASHHFKVHVQGGVATLEGQTDVMQHKGVATRLAKSAGAVRVVNRIEIGEVARLRAAANLAKGRRRAQIKRSEPRSLVQRNP